MKKVVGQTKSVGFEMGIRRTFPVSLNEAWEFLFSKEGLVIWLGKVKIAGWEKGETYTTRSGEEGTIKVFKPRSHVRLTWKKKEWDNLSTLQVRTLEGTAKTTISFHQEKLSGVKQRTEMLDRWEKVLDELEKKFATI